MQCNAMQCNAMQCDYYLACGTCDLSICLNNALPAEKAAMQSLPGFSWLTIVDLHYDLMELLHICEVQGKITFPI